MRRPEADPQAAQALGRQPAEVRRRARDDPQAAASSSSTSRPGASMPAPPRLIRQALVDLARGGSAVVVISQDLDELFEVADRLAVIHAGAPQRGAADRRMDRARRSASTCSASPGSARGRPCGLNSCRARRLAAGRARSRPSPPSSPPSLIAGCVIALIGRSPLAAFDVYVSEPSARSLGAAGTPGQGDAARCSSPSACPIASAPTSGTSAPRASTSSARSSAAGLRSRPTAATRALWVLPAMMLLGIARRAALWPHPGRPARPASASARS